MRPTEVETINSIALILFVVGLLLGTVTTVVRMYQLHRHGMRQPRLIWRDVSVFGLLALDFLLVVMHRAFEWEFDDQIWWALLTSCIAVAAVGVYCYYELFIIGHVRDTATRRDLQAKAAEQEPES